ncbi:DUF2938 domain-containing protein [Roseovarius sp. EL26]|uniref:DUF2938 domain-containing protein n=1 Tax=Roseovarius sp. EL26 TaxID=2126672 RepID=UPI000EA12E09|nr:DUF2938 domain-containing protein [Roseovarius sp. EL26]
MITEFLPSAVLIGIGATAFMDLIAFVQKQMLSQKTLNYAMVGRWLGHMARGRFIHRPISASEAIRSEGLLGWGAHYLIGVLFALVFLTLVDQNWLMNPTLMPVTIFGVLTVLAPFMILQPAMGAGLAARHAPSPNIARAKSLLAHLSFGVGLWVAATCLSTLA